MKKVILAIAILATLQGCVSNEQKAPINDDWLMNDAKSKATIIKLGNEKIAFLKESRRILETNNARNGIQKYEARHCTSVKYSARNVMGLYQFSTANKQQALNHFEGLEVETSLVPLAYTKTRYFNYKQGLAEVYNFGDAVYRMCK